MTEGASSHLSVVVIGRNEGARLSACLRSVLSAERAGHTLQLIYVDSASTDDSVQRAEALGATVISVRPERPSAATGRNAGWRAASGDLVLFLDGDTVLDANFIPEAIAEMNSAEDIAVVWGHRRESNTGGSLFNRVLDLDWIYPPGDSAFCGGDALFRRSALMACEGFDATLIAGEEPELCARLRARGYRIRHIDAPMTLHDLAMTKWRQYWRRAERAGHAYAEISARFADRDGGLWRRDARRNRLHGAALTIGLTILLGATASGHLMIAMGGGTLAVATCLRTAWRARWKSASALTLVLYGAHSHIQQIPILWGQIVWRQMARQGHRRGLIEYK
jgi:glycosyltransferase involved in cell wall biosynthesis